MPKSNAVITFCSASKFNIKYLEYANKYSPFTLDKQYTNYFNLQYKDKSTIRNKLGVYLYFGFLKEQKGVYNITESGCKYVQNQQLNVFIQELNNVTVPYSSRVSYHLKDTHYKIFNVLFEIFASYYQQNRELNTVAFEQVFCYEINDNNHNDIIQLLHLLYINKDLNLSDISRKRCTIDYIFSAFADLGILTSTGVFRYSVTKEFYDIFTSGLVNNTQKNDIVEQNHDNDIVIKALYDDNIDVQFDSNNLKHFLPISSNEKKHNYTDIKAGGTSLESSKKIISGRKAEKYFINYLISKGFVRHEDFEDVANKREYPYDIILNRVGIEIKNIASGSFYLSDNEIACLNVHKTKLILVDIDNGIWVIDSSSKWLQSIIQQIQQIREYCSNQYKSIDLTDIRIHIDQSIKEEAIDISGLSKEDLIKIIN